MRQKSVHPELPSERIVKNIAVQPANGFRLKRRSASCWMVCGASPALPSCVGVKA